MIEYYNIITEGVSKIKKLLIAFLFVLFLAIPQGVEARTICRNRFFHNTGDSSFLINNISTSVNTGNNTVFGNTVTGNVTTGNATANVTVTNRVNISTVTVSH